MYVRMYDVCMYVCMMYVRMHVCMYVRTYICMYAGFHTGGKGMIYNA